MLVWLLTILVKLVVSADGSVVFWQIAPGNFARIQRGNMIPSIKQLEDEQKIIPNHQLSTIREQKTIQPTLGQFSNNLHPFVHFSSNDALVGTPNNHLMNQFLQPPILKIIDDDELNLPKKQLDSIRENDNVIPNAKINSKSKENTKATKNSIAKLGEFQTPKSAKKNYSLASSYLPIPVKESKNPISEDSLMKKIIKKNSGSFLERLIDVMEEEKNSVEDEKEKSKVEGKERSGKSFEDDYFEQLRFFSDVGLFDHNLADEESVATSYEDEFEYEIPSFDSILDQEEEDVIEESEVLANQIIDLVDFLKESEQFEEDQEREAKRIIQTKLRRVPLEDLIRDEDFVDSVFYRFAKMELPLRSKDIDVSTNSQVKKILLNSITKAAKQTQRLLGELRQNEFQTFKQDRKSSKTIDRTKKELQHLLRIVS